MARRVAHTVFVCGLESLSEPMSTQATVLTWLRRACCAALCCAVQVVMKGSGGAKASQAEQEQRDLERFMEVSNAWP